MVPGIEAPPRAEKDHPNGGKEMRVNIPSFVMDIAHALDALQVRVGLGPPACENVFVVLRPLRELVKEK